MVKECRLKIRSRCGSIYEDTTTVRLIQLWYEVKYCVDHSLYHSLPLYSRDIDDCVAILEQELEIIEEVVEEND